jgi:hypothetical protein
MSRVSLPVAGALVKPLRHREPTACKDSRMRKAVIRAIGAGIVAGLVYAVWRAWRARVPAPTGEVRWEEAPFPFPPVPRPAPAPVAEPPAAPWVEPVDGACPASHPVKAKLSSGIFHVPGGMNYDRTRPDRCYADETSAVADGLRRSQR